MSVVNTTDIKIPFAVSVLSGILFLSSGILYSVSGASTGYVLVLIGLIVILSATRMRTGAVKDASLAVIFFGILNLISFVLMLSGTASKGPAFYTGLLGCLAALIGGYLGIIYIKQKDN